MINLVDSSVLVTGASSMIGRQVVQRLLKRQAFVYAIYGPSHGGFAAKHKIPWQRTDLTKSTPTYFYLNSQNSPLCITKINYVIHLAGYNGGIAFNKKYPADIYR